jgi:lipoprotein-releasing system ATP-binding protein
MNATTDSSTTITAQLANVAKSFTTADGELQILRDISLQLARGDSLAITGPSGSGKSTLLYILGTLDTASSGDVQILNQSPSTMTAKQLAHFRNEHIGFVFQDHHLLPQCTVLENVLIPTLVATKSNDATERARELLKRVGLEHRIDHLPARISGGERQRVAVCRALINEPELLLADEPTGNLDQSTAESVGNLLLEMSAEHQVTLVCVTHSLELASRFPRQYELREGRLVEHAAEQPA